MTKSSLSLGYIPNMYIIHNELLACSSSATYPSSCLDWITGIVRYSNSVPSISHILYLAVATAKSTVLKTFSFITSQNSCRKIKLALCPVNRKTGFLCNALEIQSSKSMTVLQEYYYIVVLKWFFNANL